MKERPILMQGAMVRALLDGSKSQTRRVVKGQSENWNRLDVEYDVGDNECFVVCGQPEPSGMRPILNAIHCPYGQPGDRLWVREAHHRTTTGSPWLIGYEIPGEDREYEVPGIGRVREFQHHLGGWGGVSSRNFPSIHMPRWACRILLEIVSVRVERLNDISEEDAIAEGIIPVPKIRANNPNERQFWRDYRLSGDGTFCKPTAVESYRSLWESINGEGSWSANPFVWAVEVKRVTP